ncbi:hypothetical protein GNI_196870 [Gregarina niphandrodes]|uniref:Uncharacterized protein n=2 Tax=Gregarina niphandrodes TaxID=110365 RepID=A0A023AW98_GRENI|nr:hypothetical protein GNI_196870 [Gregarina niphandrodes]EZG43011.1 hypothetical protein GNI_196870 [Gregarina niphandrodes]|eukprot:XP_011133716.1 hypothetical protein GNI_196870 [Gregarina niphandrodes]
MTAYKFKHAKITVDCYQRKDVLYQIQIAADLMDAKSEEAFMACLATEEGANKMIELITQLNFGPSRARSILYAVANYLESTTAVAEPICNLIRDAARDFKKMEYSHQKGVKHDTTKWNELLRSAERFDLTKEIASFMNGEMSYLRACIYTVRVLLINEPISRKKILLQLTMESVAALLAADGSVVLPPRGNDGAVHMRWRQSTKAVVRRFVSLYRNRSERRLASPFLFAGSSEVEPCHIKMRPSFNYYRVAMNNMLAGRLPNLITSAAKYQGITEGTLMASLYQPVLDKLPTSRTSSILTYDEYYDEWEESFTDQLCWVIEVDDLEVEESDTSESVDECVSDDDDCPTPIVVHRNGERVSDNQHMVIYEPSRPQSGATFTVTLDPKNPDEIIIRRHL